VKIRSVRPLSVSYPEPNDNNSTRYLTLCRVEADDGTVGWGECVPMSGSGFPEACRATEAIIQGLASLAIGLDPLDNLAIWHRIKSRIWWYGPQGIAAFALSAIDMALWDLKGKLLGIPLVSLLGGAVRERLPASAATHATLDDINAEAERHGVFVEQGFKGVKVGFSERSGELGFKPDRDVEFVRVLRAAIGPEADIMIDRGQGMVWDFDAAVKRIRGMEEHGLLWIEEPFEPHELDAFRRLRQRVDTLIATGERKWNTQEYRELIDTGTVDVIGCDPGRAEGVTGFCQLVAMVDGAGLWFNAHSWSSAINTAASLAVSALSSRCLYFELKPEENPMQHELVVNPIVQKDGWVEVLTGPGLGIEVDESVVSRYRL
jgi:L-alanine-DL-glutamate epimerase-like enolase superfamily enzyme